MTKYDAVVFDLDGTLIDSVPGIAAALNDVLADLGRVRLPVEQVRPMIGEGFNVTITKSLQATGGLDGHDIAALALRWERIYLDREIMRTQVYPGVFEVLRELQDRGVALSICTNKPRPVTRPLLEAIGLWPFMRAVVTPEDVEAMKPDPRHVLATVAAMDVRDGCAVYVGDSEIDVAAARAAMLPVVLVRYGYCRVPFDSLRPDVMIDRFDELPAALAALNGRAG
jgi:phosphoglycolate phosphatase